MCKVFIISFIFLVNGLWSQKFSSRSQHEKYWALFHPCAAIKVKKIYKKCLPLYEELKKTNALDTFQSGGKLDAFRHTFFMAAFSQTVKINKIRKLGIAHENGNYRHFLNGINEQGELPDSLAGEMDLLNNELGLKIGSQNKKKDLRDLRDIVTEEIKKGSAVYLKRNLKGQYQTCAGEIIELKDYKMKWFIPKCLIKTNE
ncbi:MAG TPA: hypothetical protein VN026_16555 [Bacteroidia bacterium]|jgi:hypothetical protein|nr:hypothetical protein [Bacteroidia bacterium]